MQKNRFLFVAVAVIGTIGIATDAAAEENATRLGASAGRSGFGIGIAAMLSGPVGPSITYDARAWHIDAIFAATDLGNSTIQAGGRFYYVVNRSDEADFSVGAGVGLVAQNNGPDLLHVEGGAKIRAFIVSNVALSATLGMALIFGGGETNFDTPAQLQGMFGITYFFF